MKEMNEIQEGLIETRNLQWGFDDLDKHTHGLHPGELILIAGRPEVGKSAFALNIAARWILEGRIPVGIIETERTAKLLMRQMACSEGRVNDLELHFGRPTGEVTKRFSDVEQSIQRAPLYIMDTPHKSFSELRDKVIELKVHSGIRVLIIDSLQPLMAQILSRDENHENGAWMVSRQIKALARGLGIPVVLLSQLHHLIYEDCNCSPTALDLDYLGPFGKEADVICLFGRRSLSPSDFDLADSSSEEVEVNVMIAKTLCGSVGKIKLGFFPAYERFEAWHSLPCRHDSISTEKDVDSEHLETRFQELAGVNS